MSSGLYLRWEWNCRQFGRGDQKDFTLWKTAHKAEIERVVNEKDHDGRTALYIAAGKANIDLVNALLTHHASVDLQHKDDCTALIIASYKGSLAICRVLLLSGADIDIQGGNDKDALTKAREKGHLDIVDLIERE